MTSVFHILLVRQTTTNGNSCYYPINSGDSGSALLANINGEIKIIGLCFAGSTSGSPDGYFTIGRACRLALKLRNN